MRFSSELHNNAHLFKLQSILHNYEDNKALTDPEVRYVQTCTWTHQKLLVLFMFSPVVVFFCNTSLASPRLSSPSHFTLSVHLEGRHRSGWINIEENKEVVVEQINASTNVLNFRGFWCSFEALQLSFSSRDHLHKTGLISQYFSMQLKEMTQDQIIQVKRSNNINQITLHD
jgi:hypothetical protein